MLVKENDIFLRSDKISPEPHSQIHLPNLHLNYYVNQKENYVKGVCLDFGLIVVKDIENNSDESELKISEIKKALIFMAQTHIHFIITEGNFDLLFKNRVPNHGEWESFAEDDNKEHSQLLQNSIDKLKIQNRDLEIQNKMNEIKGRVQAVSQQKGGNEKLDKILASVIRYQYGFGNDKSNTSESFTRVSAPRV